MKKQTVLLVVLLAAVSWVFPLGAFGQDMDSPSPFDEDTAMEDQTESDQGEETQRDINLPLEKKAKVVEKKLYPSAMKHELSLFFGVAPADSFVFSIVEGGRYTFHITEMFGLQLVGAHMDNFQRDSADRAEEAGVNMDFLKNAEINWFANLDLVFKPIYGKFSFVSNWIAHYDLGLSVGAGVMALDNGDYAPAPDIGLFMNIYLLKWLSLRADFMYYALIATDRRSEEASVDNNLGNTGVGGNERGGTLLRNNYFITVGISFHLPPN